MLTIVRRFVHVGEIEAPALSLLRGLRQDRVLDALEALVEGVRGGNAAGVLHREAQAPHLAVDVRDPKIMNLSEARSPLYQHRFSQSNTHFAAFFEIYKMI